MSAAERAMKYAKYAHMYFRNNPTFREGESLFLKVSTPRPVSMITASFDAIQERMIYRPSGYYLNANINPECVDFGRATANIEFIALCLRVYGLKFMSDITLVYVSSAVNAHIMYLYELFPMINLEIWCQSSVTHKVGRFISSTNGKIKLFEKELTTHEARIAYKNKKVILLCHSVVLPILNADSPGDAYDARMIAMNQIVEEYINIMTPVATLNWHVMPYSNNIKYHKFIGGIITIQPFVLMFTNDAYLMMFNPITRDYNLDEYEQHHMFIRYHLRNLYLKSFDVKTIHWIENGKTRNYTFKTLDINRIGSPNYCTWRFLQIMFQAYLTLKAVVQPNYRPLAVNMSRPDPNIIGMHTFITSQADLAAFPEWMDKQITSIEKILDETFLDARALTSVRLIDKIENMRTKNHD